MGWIRDIHNFIKTSRAVKEAYKKEGIIEKFNQLYGVSFKVDNVGRLYAVISPVLQNIQNNGTSQIFEFGPGGLSDKTYIEQWIMIKLNAVEKLIAAQNLLDILTFDIREVVMDGEPTGNYLVIFSPVGFEEFNTAWKKLTITIVSTLAIVGTVLGVIFGCMI